jgi:hypothetical protein
MEKGVALAPVTQGVRERTARGRLLRYGQAMPRFFLNVRDGDFLIVDPEGSDLADLAAAHSEALASARELLADALKSNRVLSISQIEITDEVGQILATISMKAAQL